MKKVVKIHKFFEATLCMKSVKMKFNPNKIPAEVIKEGAFGRTYFRDIYSGITGKWYKKSWKEFDQLKDLIRSFIVQIIMMLVSINVEHR